MDVTSARSAVRCSKCSTVYETDDWLLLALIEVVPPEEVATHVSGWPPQMCIEARVCGECGGNVCAFRLAETPRSQMGAASSSRSTARTSTTSGTTSPSRTR